MLLLFGLLTARITLDLLLLGIYRNDITLLYIGLGGSQKEIQVYGFQSKIISKFQYPIKKFSIYIQSNITNEIFPGYINLGGKLVCPEETNGIPPRAPFDVLAPFTGNGPEFGPPLTPGEFYAKIGDFTVYLNADGKEFSFRFPHSKNQKIIEKFIKQVQPAGKPKVTLKE